MGAQHTAHWALSLCFMALSLLLYLPVIYYWRKLRAMSYKFSPIVLSFWHLIITDLALFVNYGAMYSYSLYNGKLADSDSAACQVSGFIMIASVSASNVGCVAIAHTVKKSLNMNERNSLDDKFQLYYGVIGWSIGVALASYYQTTGQLGDFRTLYCGAMDSTRPDVSIPVFAVFSACITLMMYYYKAAYQQVASTMQPSRTAKVAAATEESPESPRSPRTLTLRERGAKPTNSNPAEVVVKFAYRMCGAYYLSWCPVALIAFADLVGAQRNLQEDLYADIAAGWTIKVGCVITAAVLLDMLYTSYNTQLTKLAAATVSPIASRIVTDAQIDKRGSWRPTMMSDNPSELAPLRQANFKRQTGESSFVQPQHQMLALPGDNSARQSYEVPTSHRTIAIEDERRQRSNGPSYEALLSQRAVDDQGQATQEAHMTG